MKKHFLTDRLHIDILTPADHEFILQLLNSKGWLEFIGDRNVHSKEDAVAYITKILNTENVFYWVVKIKQGNIPIGIITFLKRDYLENFDIGFAFLPNYGGMGYAYESANEILSLVNTVPGYNPVYATTIPGNVKSINLLNKLGLYFEKEMEVGDKMLHIYSSSKLRPTR